MSFIEEPIVSRDHTENMLRAVGVKIERRNSVIQVFPQEKIEAKSFNLPGDPSSAAFLIAAALMIPGSRLIIRNIGLNPTRIGFIECLKQMGASMETFGEKEEWGEARGNLVVEYSALNQIEIGGEQIPSLIDEVPILAVLATQARGQTMISGAGELRVKESDRLRAISENLNQLGAQIMETEDGLIIRGSVHLRGGKVKSYGDHRIAMSMVIAGLIANDPVEIEDIDCIEVSYPDFLTDLKAIGCSGLEQITPSHHAG